MDEFFAGGQYQWVTFLLPVVLLVILVVWFRRRAGGNRLQKVLGEISHDRIDGLLIPNGDDGEIQIDHLLLTSKGLLIVDTKDVVGIVFGSDKMQEWTVIAEDRRFTFSNPQPALFDRIAAVRQIVRQVPVAGRVVFLDGAEFTKGVPNLVTNIDDLQAEFGETDPAVANVKVEAFKPYWDLIRKEALGTQFGEILGRRNA